MIIPLPIWLNSDLYEGQRMTENEAMALAIELSQRNVVEKTGGPFGAVILQDGIVVSVGVNLVVLLKSSLYHAEVVAIMRAQFNKDVFRLTSGSLITSAQPCCMCYGTLFWSGIDELVIGARKEDVEKYTEFEEGPLPDKWELELTSRQIKVKKDVLRQQAVQSLIDYEDLHY